MKRNKSIVLLAAVLLMMSSIAVSAFWHVDYVTLYTNQNVVYGNEYNSYLAKGDGNNYIGSAGNVISSLQNKVGGNWQTLEALVLAPGQYGVTSVWGRSERDTRYWFRVKLASDIYYPDTNPGRSAYGKLYAEWIEE